MIKFFEKILNVLNTQDKDFKEKMIVKESREKRD